MRAPIYKQQLAEFKKRAQVEERLYNVHMYCYSPTLPARFHPPIPIPCARMRVYKQMAEFKKRAQAEERLYNVLMPDRNWGINHPATWILLAVCIVLHIYTGHRTKQVEAIEQERKKEEARLMEKDYIEPASPRKGWE